MNCSTDGEVWYVCQWKRLRHNTLSTHRHTCTCWFWYWHCNYTHISLAVFLRWLFGKMLMSTSIYVAHSCSNPVMCWCLQCQPTEWTATQHYLYNVNPRSSDYVWKLLFCRLHPDLLIWFYNWHSTVVVLVIVLLFKPCSATVNHYMMTMMMIHLVEFWKQIVYVYLWSHALCVNACIMHKLIIAEIISLTWWMYPCNSLWLICCKHMYINCATLTISLLLLLLLLTIFVCFTGTLPDITQTCH